MSLHAGTRRALLSTQAGGTNGLLNALIAYWPGNEANGDLIDVHTNGLNLTDVNTVTSAAGKVYATARQYTRSNSENHTRPGDDALFSAGDTDFTIALWCLFDSLAASMICVSKDNVANNREYQLYYTSVTNRLRFEIFNNANNSVGLVDDTTVLSTGVWYLVIAWHDAVANTVSIVVNNEAVLSSASTGVPNDGAAPFRIGSHTYAYFDGRIGPTMFWKSAPGGGGVLTAAQRTALYNGGAGLRYDQFTL